MLAYRYLQLLLEPVGLVAALLLMAIIYFVIKKNKTAWRLGLTTFIIYMVFATPLGANKLVGILEDRYPGPSRCVDNSPDFVIVVLAGGMSGQADSVDELERLHSTSYRRALGGLRLAKQHPQADLYFIGGSLHVDVSESELMAHLITRLESLGDRVVVEDDSANTVENARALASLLQARNLRHIYLVSSALHMPRAVSVFEKLGFDVCAYPVDRLKVEPKYWGALVPQISALIKSTQAIHEIYGYMFYFFMEWV
jgi:uncharacterized SAM-binding protein YcdF (DUF218 family)